MLYRSKVWEVECRCTENVEMDVNRMEIESPDGIFISYVFYFYWSVNFHSKVGLAKILTVKRDFLVFYFIFLLVGAAIGIRLVWETLSVAG